MPHGYIKRVSPTYFDRTLVFTSTLKASDFTITPEQKQHLNEIVAWERQSAKSNSVLGKLRNKPLSPLRT